MTASAPTAPSDPLAHRLRQAGLIAEFGLFALRTDVLQPVLDEACRVAADGLRTRFAKVLRHLPSERAFLVQAGVGWNPGVVGHARVGADLESPAGYAFHTGAPVISNHLAQEGRFRTPAMMAEHGIRRAFNVILGDPTRDAYGVLETDSNEDDDFSADDIGFLQALANVAAAAVDREARAAVLARSEAFSRRVVESSPDCVAVLDADGRLQAMNSNGATMMGIETVATLVGTPWGGLWPAEAATAAADAVATARGGRTGCFQACRPVAGAAPRWWDVLVAPVCDPPSSGAPEQLVAICRDVTERVADAAAKDALLREKDLLMREVHHRVRNSLQLVRSLLDLQGRTLADPAAQGQIVEAARRVMTIAAVHQRLDQGGSVTDGESASYLAGLLDDLRGSLTDVAMDRAIRLAATPARLAADDLTSLGLITVELVTNALKYGAGEVRVATRLLPGVIELTVEDEGGGFPAGFDPRRGGGLGMRLVTAAGQGRPRRGQGGPRRATRPHHRPPDGSLIGRHHGMAAN